MQIEGASWAGLLPRSDSFHGSGSPGDDPAPCGLSCSQQVGCLSRRVAQVEEVASSASRLPSRVFSSCWILKAACCLALSMKPLAISGTPQHFSPRKQLDTDVHGVEHRTSSLPSWGGYVVHATAREVGVWRSKRA